MADRITYNTALSAWLPWQCALELLAEMQRARIAPDRISHNALLTALERGGEWVRQTSAIHECDGRRENRCVPYGTIG